MPSPLAIFTLTERLFKEAEGRARKIAKLPPGEREKGLQGEAQAIRVALLRIGVPPADASKSADAIVADVRLFLARMTGGLA